MSIVVRVWKCRSVRPVDALEKVTEESRDVVDVERRVILAGDDQEVFGQRELALTEQGIGDGQDLLWPSHAGVGDVTFAGDGQEKGMHSGRIDGVNGMDAG